MKPFPAMLTVSALFGALLGMLALCHDRNQLKEEIKSLKAERDAYKELYRLFQ